MSTIVEVGQFYHEEGNMSKHKPRTKGRTGAKLRAIKAEQLENHAKQSIRQLAKRRTKRWDKIGDNYEKFAFTSLGASTTGRSQVGTKTTIYRLPDKHGRIVSFATKRIKHDRIRGIAQPNIRVIHFGEHTDKRGNITPAISGIVGMKTEEATKYIGERGKEWLLLNHYKQTGRRVVVVPRAKWVEQLADSLADEFQTRRDFD